MSVISLTDLAVDTGRATHALVDGLLRGLLLAWPIWGIAAAMVLVRVVFALWRRWRLARSGIREIDRLSGAVFEEYLELLFRRLGYRVQRTRAAGDFGGDLVIADKDGARTVVQAKRYSKAVGVRAVQEVVAAMRAYDCERAMVVTNNRFTKQAGHLAAKNDVELWDRDELVRRLTAAGGRRALRRARRAA